MPPVCLSFNLSGRGLCEGSRPQIRSVSEGSTPVLSSEEATALLTGMDVSTIVALRDRAVIAVMTYAGASDDRKGTLFRVALGKPRKRPAQR